MNSSVLFPNIIRFIVLTLVQVVLMRQLSLTGSGYLNIFLYPIFILYLPLAMSVPLLIFLSFLIGMSVDLFYGSIGIHAAASVFSGWARGYLNIFLYPIFILYLPLAMSVPLLILLSFLIGMSVDLFYGSIGIHAAASVFSGWARGYLIRAYEPRGGYAPNILMPSKGWLGNPWFLRYAAIFMVLHIFFYFSVDAFTYVYIGTITLKTIVCWLLSMLFVVFYSTILNPKE